jgi:hypothetical protein
MMGIPFRYSPGSSLDQCHRLLELGYSVWCDDLSTIDENYRGIVQDAENYLNVIRRKAKSEEDVDDFIKNTS